MTAQTTKQALEAAKAQVKELAAKAKADADKADKLKAETAPTQAAGTRKTEQSAANDATKARQERIAAYKAKVQRDFTAVTQKEMDQYKADSDEELKHKLSLAGYEK
jgi:hypothetical protein